MVPEIPGRSIGVAALDTVVIVLVLAAYQLGLGVQGVDLTDLGFHATNQIMTLEGDAPRVNCFWLLSDLVGGIWLSLIGGPSLFWLRAGGGLLFGLCAGVTHRTLRHWTDRRSAFFFTLGTGIVVAVTFETQIHYYTWPSFLTASALWAFSNILCRESSKSKTLWAFLLGILVTLLPLSQITKAAFVAIPCGMYLYYYLKGTRHRVNGRDIVALLAGAAVSLCCCVLLFYFTGTLALYIDGILQLAGVANTESLKPPGYSLRTLLRNFVLSAFAASAWCFLLLAIVPVFGWIHCRLGRWTSSATAIAIATSILVGGPPAKQWHGLFSTVLPLFLSAQAAFVLGRQRATNSKDYLIIGAVLAMLLFPTGSNTGIYKAAMAMWIALPLVLLALRDGESGSGYRRYSAMGSVPVFLVLVMMAVPIKLGHIYRDIGDRRQLTVMPSHPTLWGIFTTKDRALSLDDVLFEIDRRTHSGESVQIIVTAPTLYYLTETRPTISVLWLGGWDAPKLKELYQRQNGLPKLVVGTLQSPRAVDWPLSKDDQKWEDKTDQEALFELYRNDGFEVVWSNEMFFIASQGDDADTNSSNELRLPHSEE